MENTSYIALSRQTALWRQLDMVANNLANMNTPAFKGEGALFTEYLMKSPSDERTFKDKLSFTQDFGTVRDLKEGPMLATGNPLDVGIHGEGYFTVETPDGIRYTRSGQFNLDNEGKLVTAEGFPVLSTNNEPFFFAPNENNIEISRDGTISTENGVIGNLRLVTFENGQKLSKTYGSLYVTSEDNPPKDAEKVELAQGMLEQSNVQPVVEITRMIDIQRSYGFVQKLIEEEHERQRKAVDILPGRMR